MNLIIITENDQTAEKLYRLNDNRFIHIKDILKLEKNDVLEIGLLNGPIGTGKIISIDDNAVLIELAHLQYKKILPYAVDVICALPRPQTLKKVLNISSTMGVENLYLIRSEKVEKSYFHSPLLNPDNYTNYLIEGLSQGRRTKLPKVYIYKRFKDFFTDKLNFNNSSSALIIADQETDHFLEQSDISNKQNITLAIGPEGGWNEYEINFFTERGFLKIKLSHNTLRVENALTAALAQVELLLS